MEPLAQLLAWQKQAVGHEKRAANMGVALRLLRHGIEAVAELEKLRAELAECRQDAERYRWIRIAQNLDRVYELDGEVLDQMIDAARKGEGE